jgi:hypothetical protein
LRVRVFSLGDRYVRQPVRRLLESVTFVRIDVCDRDAFGLHCRDDRIAFGDLAADIVGAVENQHRLLDAIDLVDRRTLGE